MPALWSHLLLQEWRELPLPRGIGVLTSQGIKQICHQLGGFNGSIFLFLFREGFDTNKEQKLIWVIHKFINGEFNCPRLITKSIKADLLKVSHDGIQGPFMTTDTPAIQVVQNLVIATL